MFSAAYEAIMELLKSSPRDCYVIVQETTVTIIARLEELLHHRQNSNEKGGSFNDLQSLLCATLQVTTDKLKQLVVFFVLLLEMKLNLFSWSEDYSAKKFRDINDKE